MNTYIKNDNEVFKVRDEDIEVVSNFRFDSDTHEKIFDEELDNMAINKAFDKYRRKNNILGKDEFKRIRETFNLSQRDFSKITGIGKASISRYEKGALPSKVNNSLYIDLKKGTNKIVELFNMNKINLEESLQINFLKRIEELKDLNENEELKSIEIILCDDNVDINNGFKKMNLRKLEVVIDYFASKLDYISKTKLNKLLFYTDFIYFSRYTKSMIGLTYIKNHYGPVPQKADLLYGLLVEEGSIEWEPFGYMNGYTGEYIKSNVYEEYIFDKKEEEVLRRVVELFKDDNANEISKKSHEEIGWKNTEMKSRIPYSYSSDLIYK